jgi:NADH:ubiquinone oxidoreductase subunit 6 (subunit J)
VNSRQTAVAAISAIAFLLLIIGTILTVTWSATGPQQFTNEQLGTAVFDSWGPTLIVVGLLMFASMLGGVYIAQEDRE